MMVVSENAANTSPPKILRKRPVSSVVSATSVPNLVGADGSPTNSAM
jgi:hypothetical protein